MRANKITIFKSKSADIPLTLTFLSDTFAKYPASRNETIHHIFLMNRKNRENTLLIEKEMLMKKMVFESKLLTDGHLYCPDEFAQKTNARFKVIVTFEETEFEASEREVELSAIQDASWDFLSEEELKYHLNLKDL